MKRSRTVSFETEVYRSTSGEDELEIEVEVSGSANPYCPGNYENPPEGGDIEDIRATFWDESAKKHRDIPLTEDEVKEFSEQLAEREALGDC